MWILGSNSVLSFHILQRQKTTSQTRWKILAGRHIAGKVFRFYWNGLNYISDDDLRGAPFITTTATTSSFWSTTKKAVSFCISSLPLFHNIAKMKKNWTCFFAPKKFLVVCLFSLPFLPSSFLIFFAKQLFLLHFLSLSLSPLSALSCHFIVYCLAYAASTSLSSSFALLATIRPNGWERKKEKKNKHRRWSYQPFFVVKA